MFTEQKSQTPLERTYSFSGAKRELSNVQRLSQDPDLMEYSLERLDECFVGRSVKGDAFIDIREDKPEEGLNTIIKQLERGIQVF